MAVKGQACTCSVVVVQIFVLPFCCQDLFAGDMLKNTPADFKFNKLLLLLVYWQITLPAPYIALENVRLVVFDGS